MNLVAIMPFLIPIVAILAGTWASVQKMKAKTQAELGKTTAHLDEELAAAKAERDRLRKRLEAVEAIVTSEGFDLEREARRAGITDAADRIDPSLLDLDRPGAERSGGERRRTH